MLRRRESHSVEFGAGMPIIAARRLAHDLVRTMGSGVVVSCVGRSIVKQCVVSCALRNIMAQTISQTFAIRDIIPFVTCLLQWTDDRRGGGKDEYKRMALSPVFDSKQSFQSYNFIQCLQPQLRIQPRS